jgi:hypothetical protein
MAASAYRRFKSNVRARSFIHDGVKVVTASASATRAQNAGKTTALSAAAGLTITLPASRGQGDRYRFLVKTLLTSNTYVVKVANSTDVMTGGIFINNTGDTTAATVDFYPTAAASDTVTFDSAIGAGKAGDWIEVEDYAAGFWAVTGVFQGEDDPATPFSATV